LLAIALALWLRRRRQRAAAGAGLTALPIKGAATPARDGDASLKKKSAAARDDRKGDKRSAEREGGGGKRSAEREGSGKRSAEPPPSRSAEREKREGGGGKRSAERDTRRADTLSVSNPLAAAASASRPPGASRNKR